MSLPTPAVPLNDACSVMFNNTLYSYSPDAFQSLPLVEGGVWSQLSMGEAVTGGVCVKSTPANGSATALYIVGGSSKSSSYQGLQRYIFADEKWETVSPSVLVTQNRLYHNAVYLNASDSILVYAGRQDGTDGPSSQTFTIQASEPYTVLAYQSIAPPAVYPILMQWTESTAVYIGGSNDNTEVMEFDPSTSWVSTNATLAEPLYNTTAIKATIINGDDGSKSLYTFDMTVTPNAVNRTVLMDGNGDPVKNSTVIVSTRSLDERALERVKRDYLTLEDWPAYNGTLAPTSTRKSYSIAEGTDGEVVISGGNEKDPLCIFSARQNCWTNATAVLKDASTQTVLGSSGSPSSTTASAASSTASSAPATKSVAKAFPAKTLGAVLGSFIGIALILIGVLIFFRWRRRRRDHAEAGHQRRASGLPDEKNPMDFMERHSPQMSSARQVFKSHEQQSSQGSFSSMAILMGRVGHRRGSTRGNEGHGSDSSSQFNKNYKTAISNPIPQEQLPYEATAGFPRDAKEVSFGQGVAVPRPRTSKTGRRGSMRRSSGWNRYWSGGSAMNYLGFGGGSRRTTFEGSDASSEYSEPRIPSQGPSTIIPPLKIPGQPELYKVSSGSPTIATNSSQYPIGREMSGYIERSGSVSSSSSFDTRHDAFSSGVPESVNDHDSWPAGRQDWAPGRPSNAYTESVYTSGQPRSTVGNFPFPTPPQTQRAPQPPVSTDMSWLNLGHDARI